MYVFEDRYIKSIEIPFNADMLIHIYVLSTLNVCMLGTYLDTKQPSMSPASLKLLGSTLKGTSNLIGYQSTQVLQHSAYLLLYLYWLAAALTVHISARMYRRTFAASIHSTSNVTTVSL